MTAIEHDCLSRAEGNWDGTRDTGAYATSSDVTDYLEWLGAQVTDSTDRRALLAAGTAIHDHESLTDAMIHGTGNLSGLPHAARQDHIDNPAREGWFTPCRGGLGRCGDHAEQGGHPNALKGRSLFRQYPDPLGWMAAFVSRCAITTASTGRAVPRRHEIHCRLNGKVGRGMTLFLGAKNGRIRDVGRHRRPSLSMPASVRPAGGDVAAAFHEVERCRCGDRHTHRVFGEDSFELVARSETVGATGSPRSIAA